MMVCGWAMVPVGGSWSVEATRAGFSVEGLAQRAVPHSCVAPVTVTSVNGLPTEALARYDMYAAKLRPSHGFCDGPHFPTGDVPDHFRRRWRKKDRKLRRYTEKGTSESV